MRRFAKSLTLAAVTSVVLSAPATAQEPVPTVRTAGDGTRFRVIQRIPHANTIQIEQLAWPYSRTVRQAVEIDDWEAAWKELQSVEPDRDERFRFLWAWVALKGEAWDKAEKVFAEIGASKEGLLQDYGNRYAAEAAYRAGRYGESAGYAAHVTRGSVAYPSAALFLARSLVQRGDDDGGIRALTAFIDAFPGDDDVPTARVELARVLHKVNRHEDAAKQLVRVRREHPLWSGLDGDFDTLEGAVLAKLPKTQRQSLTKRRPADWITEYRVRFSAHDSKDVVDGLSTRVTKWAKKSSERCEGFYLVGNSFTKLRKHGDSVGWYERVVSECKGEPVYIKALYKGGKGYWNSGKKSEAYRFFEKMWTEFPAHSYADDGMYFGSRILTELEKLDEAKSLLKKQVDKYPDGDMASDAHWLILRDMFKHEKYSEVVEYVDGLPETGEKDLYSHGRLHYFRARALQKLGKADDARAAYAEVVRKQPMSYYALFALNRLAEMVGAKGTDVCKVADGALCKAIATTAGQPIAVDAELGSELSFRRGKAFLQVSLDGFAALEFGRLRKSVGGEPEKLWTLAALLDASGAYPFSHNIPRREIENWETFYPDRDRAQRWHVAYPAPFQDEVVNWAEKRNLRPELVWAIMREESGFNPRIRSWAGAIGLIQLMPGTAKLAAKRDGTSFDQTKLTEPDYNVRLGTAYLEELAGDANSHPVLMISGYNGGWGNVGSWLEDPDSDDLDLWVEDIPYGQTRHYTKRVLRSFWVYSWLYGDEAVPRFDLKVGKKG